MSWFWKWNHCFFGSHVYLRKSLSFWEAKTPFPSKKCRYAFLGEITLKFRISNFKIYSDLLLTLDQGLLEAFWGHFWELSIFLVFGVTITVCGLHFWKNREVSGGLRRIFFKKCRSGFLGGNLSLISEFRKLKYAHNSWLKASKGPCLDIKYFSYFWNWYYCFLITLFWKIH